MRLSREDWTEALRLLDAALELPLPERARWLEALADGPARLKPALEQLLAQRASIETADFLNAGARLPAADAGAFAEGGTIGPYRLLRLAGSGGMAVVWLAERADDAHRRPVALKLPLLAGRPREYAARFARERRILSALAHPHIAAVLDAGVEGAQPWLALEWVDGQPITAHCAEHRLDVPTRLALFVQVLRALQYAHAQLVIHRDLKPSNVLVDTGGQAKLLDFGVAKLLQPDGSGEATELTQLGGRAMTPQYASPEQVAGQPLGTASDVYSAGVLLYELLTGQRPYKLQRESAAALEQAILSAQVIAPSAATSDRATARALAGDVDAIVQKALAHAPGDRYASVAAFADDIEHHLARRPIVARPPARWYVASRFIRRHRFGFATGTALVAALGVGLAATIWQGQRAEREAQRAGAIKDFLVSVFSANDPRLPSDKPPGQITARELLDASVERIEREFAADPPTMIELLGVTGEIYGSLQEAERFERMWTRRIELARREYGERHPIVVQARITDAWAMIWARDYVGARRELEQIDALIGATRGTRSLEAAEWWLAQRSAFEAEAGAAAADQRLRAAQRAVELFEAIDPRSRSLAVALANLGGEHVVREDFVRARERYTQALQAFSRGRQGDLGDLGGIELRLGQLNFALGDHDAAERSFAAVHERDSRRGGVVMTWVVVSGYATFLHHRGERERARKLFAAALDTLPTSPTPALREATLHRAWGEALLAEGRASEALAPLQAAWAAAQQRAGAADDPRRAALLLARAHAALGDKDQARALFERALADFARHAPGSMAEGNARVHWADFLSEHGDAAAAQAEYRAVLDAAGARLFEALPRAQLGLATLAAAGGDLDSAWRLAEQARISAEQLTGGHDVRLHAEVWRTLAQLAQRRGDTAAAALWAERALAASTRHDGADSASVQAARALLVAGSARTP